MTKMVDLRADLQGVSARKRETETNYFLRKGMNR